MLHVEKLGKKIKELRLSRKLTQEQLAESLGVTVSAVSKWETAFTTPELGMLIRLATLFDVSVDVLLDYEVNSISIEEWTERINKMTKRREYDEMEAEVEKMLLKHPNDFRVVSISARAFRLAGLEADSQYDEKAIDLYKRSLLLFHQNTDRRITEEVIKTDMAASLNNLNRYDEAIQQLEEINQNGHYSAQIGYTLANKEEVTKEELEKASKYLQESFDVTFQTLLNIVIGNLNVYSHETMQSYEKALNLSQLLIDILDSVTSDRSITYLHKLKLIFMTYQSVILYKLKNEEQLNTIFTDMCILAKTFDKAPNYSIGSILNFSDDQEERVFDSLGESAIESVSKIFQTSRLTEAEKNEINNIWLQMLEEDDYETE